MNSAHAGGLERGGYNIDLAVRSGAVRDGSEATYVMPDRKLKNAVDTDPDRWQS